MTTTFPIEDAERVVQELSAWLIDFHGRHRQAADALVDAQAAALAAAGRPAEGCREALAVDAARRVKDELALRVDECGRVLERRRERLAAERRELAPLEERLRRAATSFACTENPVFLWEVVALALRRGPTLAHAGARDYLARVAEGIVELLRGPEVAPDEAAESAWRLFDLVNGKRNRLADARAYERKLLQAADFQFLRKTAPKADAAAADKAGQLKVSVRAVYKWNADLERHFAESAPPLQPDP